MNNRLIGSAAASVLLAAATAANAQAPGSTELEELKAQLQALQSRVDELERRQEAQQEARQPQQARQEAQDRKTDAVARARASTGDWVDRFQFKGDLRYRHERVNPEEAASAQTRQRIRARFGFTAKINDSVNGTLRLATTGGNSDPRSTNQTLGSGWDRKGFGVDLAYLDWKALDGMNVLLGKMPQPFQKTGSYFFDNDITPEGGAVRYASGPFFASAFGYWLSERSAASDATLIGGQVGMRREIAGTKLTGAVGYFDVGAVRGQVASQGSGCAVSPNTAFFGGAQGNTTVSVGGCQFLVNDYDMVQVLAQAETRIGPLPLVVFADYIQNQAVDDFDTGYAFGGTLGKASDAHTWEVGYVYQKTEKDATFGQFVDSDFGGGITDIDGSVFKLSYAPARNWLVNGTYFLNKRFIDVGTRRDYDRYQLDFAYQF